MGENRKIVQVQVGNYIVARHDNVQADRVPLLVEQLKQQYPEASVLVSAQPSVPAPATPSQRPAPRAPLGFGARGEQAGAHGEETEAVELAHHMLWDSYQRAAQTQAYMLEQMTAVGAEMNRRFVDQMEHMQQRYQAAMGKVDAMAFEQKMIEHETTARRLADHHRRLADADRRANEPGAIEQIARHFLNILELVGDPNRK